MTKYTLSIICISCSSISSVVHCLCRLINLLHSIYLAPYAALSSSILCLNRSVNRKPFFAEVDVCHSNPCANGATCVESADSYKCLCLPSYGGEHCEIGTRSASASAILTTALKKNKNLTGQVMSNITDDDKRQ